MLSTLLWAQADQKSKQIFLAETILKEIDSEQAQKAFVELGKELHKEVVNEIEKEALELSMNRDQYIESGVSSKKFLSNLTSDFSKEDLTKAEKMILLFKTGLRMKIQKSVRFVPEDLFKNMEEVRKIAVKLDKDLGLNMF